jgi:hypothetical protein
MALKNSKHCPQTHNQPKTKNISKLIYVFLYVFKVRKILNLNPSYHVKLFDIKFDPFYGRNCHWPQFFLSKPEPRDLPSPPLKKNLKRGKQSMVLKRDI